MSVPNSYVMQFGISQSLVLLYYSAYFSEYQEYIEP